MGDRSVGRTPTQRASGEPSAPTFGGGKEPISGCPHCDVHAPARYFGCLTPPTSCRERRFDKSGDFLMHARIYSGVALAATLFSGLLAVGAASAATPEEDMIA